MTLLIASDCWWFVVFRWDGRTLLLLALPFNVIIHSIAGFEEVRSSHHENIFRTGCHTFIVIAVPSIRLDTCFSFKRQVNQLNYIQTSDRRSKRTGRRAIAFAGWVIISRLEHRNPSLQVRSTLLRRGLILSVENRSGHQQNQSDKSSHTIPRLLFKHPSHRLPSDDSLVQSANHVCAITDNLRFYFLHFCLHHMSAPFIEDHPCTKYIFRKGYAENSLPTLRIPATFFRRENPLASKNKMLR